ncbi:L-rhamnose mutarotase, partial [Acinetobacter baumannii]
MADRSLWMATLKADKADAYARMHDGLPAEIAAQLMDKGFRNLDIYRSGLSLFMTWETDSALAVPDRTVREEAELAWE